MELINYPSLAEPGLLLNSLFRDFERQFDSSNTGYYRPAVFSDSSTDEQQIAIELPGVAKKDLTITVHNQQLTVKAHRAKLFDHDASASKGKDYLYRLQLGNAVDQENIKADFRDGLLLITLGKTKAAAAKEISIGD